MSIYLFQNEEEYNNKVELLYHRIKYMITDNISDIYSTGNSLLTKVKFILSHELRKLNIQNDDNTSYELERLSSYSIKSAYASLKSLFKTALIYEFTFTELIDFLTTIIMQHIHEELYYNYIQNENIQNENI